jgi:hypothetical protein
MDFGVADHMDPKLFFPAEAFGDQVMPVDAFAFVHISPT